jgi:PAS domain S-box-containing protein
MPSAINTVELAVSIPTIHSTLEKTRILHVDDDSSLLNVSKLLLEEKNNIFEIETVTSTDDAFLKLATGTYDAIISDYEMPQKNGLDFLKELREGNDKTPFILFTGKGREEIAIQALNLGADAYINKHGAPEVVYTELEHSIELVVDRNKARQNLGRSEAQFRLLAENSHDVIWTMNLEGKFTYVSPSVYQLRGYTALEAMKQNISEIYTPDSFKTVREYFEAFNRTGTIPQNYVELEHTRKDGSTVWIEVNFSVIKDKNGIPESILGVSRNISKRKEIEATLKESEERYRNLVENTQDAITIVDFKGRVLFANKASETLTGYPLSEITNIKDVTPKKLWLKSISILIRARMGKRVPYFEYEIRRKDGSIVAVETGGQAIFKDGKPVAIQIITRDITDRRKAEQQILDDRSKLKTLNEKMKVVGGLTRHDVKNKHMAIKAHIYMLRKKFGDNPELIKHLEGIDLAVNQSEKIFEFSRLYEKIGAEEFLITNVGESLEEAIKLLPEVGGVKIVNECQPLTVLADSMLRQLFYNLVDNSLKHGKKVTEIRLSYIQEKGITRIVYEDNGAGIAFGDKDRIFEGFTTGGSGLGLKLAKKMIEAYGWSVRENGVPGIGARFEITISN